MADENLTLRFRGLVVGKPKVGKTGSVAELANRGYRVIIAAFDPGADVIYQFVKPECRDNIIILPYQDRRSFAEAGKLMVKTVGADAFGKFAILIDEGRARDIHGNVHDFGPADTWDDKTVLVLDNLTSFSKAAYDAYLARAGNNRAGLRRKDWGLSAAEVDQMLIWLTGSYFKFHLVILAHWKVQGPQAWDEDTDGEKSDYNNELRQREKELIPTRMVPVSIGRQLSENLTYHFPTVVWVEVTDDGRRIFNLKPSSVKDVGVPVPVGRLADELPIETGLADILEAVTKG